MKFYWLSQKIIINCFPVIGIVPSNFKLTRFSRFPFIHVVELIKLSVQCLHTVLGVSVMFKRLDILTVTFYMYSHDRKKKFSVCFFACFFGFWFPGVSVQVPRKILCFVHLACTDWRNSSLSANKSSEQERTRKTWTDDRDWHNISGTTAQNATQHYSTNRSSK